jgi:cytochrome P450 PksS
VSFGGHGVPAGFTVLSVLASANRDEAVFDRPDDFDVTRGPSAQLTFGGAVHHCLGEPLARLEAEIAVRAIVTRFPDLRLAADEVDWLETFTQRGPKALPVAV